MIDTGVAFRYARALYELATEQNLAARVTEDMLTLERLFEEIPEALHFCRRERDNRKAELEFIEIAFIPNVGELTSETLKTAIRNGRIGILPFLPKAFREIRDRSENTLRVLVETAHEPGIKIIEQIQASMARRTGKRIEMETDVIPEILGGVRISWDSRLIDLSAASQLKRMRAWIKSA